MVNESAIHRVRGAIALMFTGLGSIIGSGWLFGAWRAAQLAGPGAIYAWIVGAVVILFVALSYAELRAMFPEAGGARASRHLSPGCAGGFLPAWGGWVGVGVGIPGGAGGAVQIMRSRAGGL